MLRTAAAVASAAALLATPAGWGQTAPSTRPAAVSVADLKRAGLAAKARIAAKGARWTATVTLTGHRPAVAAWYQSPAGARVDVSTLTDGRTVPAFSVTARDGWWYVTEGTRSAKCRPFAYPFADPTAMTVFWAGFLRSTDMVRSATVAIEPAGDGTAVVRERLPPAMADQLRGLCDRYDALVRADPAGVKANLDEPTRLLYSRLHDVLDHGLVSRFDLVNGVMLEATSVKQTVVVTGLKWLDGPDPAALDVSGRSWDERTAGGPLAAGVDPADLATMNVAGDWRPGRPPAAVECRVVDVRTGDSWRVPFQGAAVTDAAFTPDRRSVVACGVDVDNGGIHPVLIDLKTGVNRPLGVGSLPAGGLASLPAVSPDGKTVALLYAGGAGQPSSPPQLYLVDLATGTAVAVGRPMETGRPSWLPDGTALVCGVRVVGRGGRSTASLTRVDRDGRAVELRTGDDPVVLAREGRILFADDALGGPKRWMTCDLDGDDAKVVGDGLPTFGFPAVSPDGKRLLLVEYPGKAHPAPVPTVLSWPALEPRPVPVGPGLWTVPAW